MFYTKPGDTWAISCLVKHRSKPFLPDVFGFLNEPGRTSFVTNFKFPAPWRRTRSCARARMCSRLEFSICFAWRASKGSHKCWTAVGCWKGRIDIPRCLTVIHQLIKMTAANLTTNKFFLEKKFYLHITRSSKAQADKSAELIKTFGGQIEQFLDSLVAYVLTDIPKNEWPPNGHDPLLERARKSNVKLMSVNDLTIFSFKYLTSQSSSDDDDEIRANLRQLQPPFIKFEDEHSRYAPSVREFKSWPELHINSSLTIGKSFFSDANSIGTPSQSLNHAQHPNCSAQLTQQAISTRHNTLPMTPSAHTALNNNPQQSPSNSVAPNQSNLILTSGVRNCLFQAGSHILRTQPQQGAVRRRHSVYCEICNIKIHDKIEEHVQTSAHRANTDKLDWSDVSQVIDSLPKLSSLNMRRITNLSSPTGIDHQEFFCLHKVDSVSQLFFNSARDLSTAADRKLYHVL